MLHKLMCMHVQSLIEDVDRYLASSLIPRLYSGKQKTMIYFFENKK